MKNLFEGVFFNKIYINNLWLGKWLEWITGAHPQVMISPVTVHWIMGLGVGRKPCRAVPGSIFSPRGPSSVLSTHLLSLTLFPEH